MNDRTDIPFPSFARGEPDGPELNKVWTLLGRVTPPSSSQEETEAAWASLRRRLDLGSAPHAPQDAAAVEGTPPGTARVIPLRARASASSPSDARGRSLLRAAAVAALLLVGASAVYQIPVTRSAAPGERLAVELPDGSEATLNAGSSVRYRRAFSILPGIPAGARAVRLEGEAFFDVATGDRPFRVSAADATVRVLGTRFNVRARRPGVRVSVEEGRVELSAREGSSLVLGAGEAARVGGEAATVREAVRPERIASWRTGGLTAVDEPLAVILDELALRYAVSVGLADSVSGTERLSVYYPRLGSLESVLSDLTTQQDLRYRRTADGWEVF